MENVDPENVIGKSQRELNYEKIIKLVTPDKALAGTGLYTAPTKEEFQTAYNNIISRAGFDSIDAVKNDDIYFMIQFSHGRASRLVGTLFIATTSTIEFFANGHQLAEVVQWALPVLIWPEC